MEKKDEELIQSLLEREPELRRYYEEHVDLERRLAVYQQKLHLTTEKRWRRSGCKSSSSRARTRSWRSWPVTAHTEPMRHTISVLVENEFGVLARVAGLFSGRGFNIESLSVAETMDPTVSRITLVTRGDDQVLEQIEKQLYKLIAVIKVGDFTATEHVERELVLIKVRADERTRGELANIVDIFRAKIIDVSRESYIVEITGAEEKVNALVELLKPLGILEIVRTGKVAMYRGTRVLTVNGKEKERAA